MQMQPLRHGIHLHELGLILSESYTQLLEVLGKTIRLSCHITMV